MSINLHITSSHNSNSNSPIERAHSTLLEILRVINEDANFKELSIEDKMHQAVFFYNNSIHSVTKYTPFELFFGRKYDDVLQPNLESLMEHQNEMFNKISPILFEKKKKIIDKRNKSRKLPQNFEENQVAFVTKDRRTKLTPKFRKVKIKNQNKVTVIDSTNRKLHKNKMRSPRILTD